MKILVVDELLTTRQIIAGHLLALGHSVAEAASGSQAVLSMQAEPPDMVLLAIQMSDMDGYATARALRALEGQGLSCAHGANQGANESAAVTDWLPIVFMADHISDEDLALGLEAGGDEFLVRPPSRGALRVKLHAMGRIAQMRRRLMSVGTELRDVNASLRQLSSLDALTGIANRRSFDQALEELTRRAVAAQRPLTLLIGDIDYFKRYNDYYGMQAGDECLRQVAMALQRSVRNGECLARYGGEEFAILLSDADAAAAEVVANRVLGNVRGLRRPHTTSRCAEHVTLSLGVAVALPGQEYGAADLAGVADRALYRAKLQGRNQAAIDLLGVAPPVALAG